MRVLRLLSLYLTLSACFFVFLFWARPTYSPLEIRLEDPSITEIYYDIGYGFTPFLKVKKSPKGTFVLAPRVIAVSRLKRLGYAFPDAQVSTPSKRLLPPLKEIPFQKKQLQKYDFDFWGYQVFWSFLLAAGVCLAVSRRRAFWKKMTCSPWDSSFFLWCCVVLGLVQFSVFPGIASDTLIVYRAMSNNLSTWFSAVYKLLITSSYVLFGDPTVLVLLLNSLFFVWTIFIIKRLFAACLPQVLAMIFASVFLFAPLVPSLVAIVERPNIYGILVLWACVQTMYFMYLDEKNFKKYLPPLAALFFCVLIREDNCFYFFFILIAIRIFIENKERKVLKNTLYAGGVTVLTLGLGIMLNSTFGNAERHTLHRSAISLWNMSSYLFEEGRLSDEELEESKAYIRDPKKFWKSVQHNPNAVYTSARLDKDAARWIRALFISHVKENPWAFLKSREAFLRRIPFPRFNIVRILNNNIYLDRIDRGEVPTEYIATVYQLAIPRRTLLYDRIFRWDRNTPAAKKMLMLAFFFSVIIYCFRFLDQKRKREGQRFFCLFLLCVLFAVVGKLCVVILLAPCTWAIYFLEIEALFFFLFPLLFAYSIPIPKRRVF